MAKKSENLTLQEIASNEISLVEANDKIVKLEKEKIRFQKIIAEYKEREKATARALILYERKIKYLKDVIVNEILQICKDLGTNKQNLDEVAKKIASEFIRDSVLDVNDNFTLSENKLYEVCNKLEKNAAITNSDRAFISNKKVETEKQDSSSRFDKLKEMFNQKIGASVMRKPGRPKKSEQSIIADIGLRHKVEKKVDESSEATEKLNEIFYSSPTQKKVVSSIPKSDDSEFDFNEALNPNLSLKDIMADLMTEKSDEDIVTYDKNSTKNEIEKGKNQSRVELLESGFIRNPVIHTKHAKNVTIDTTLRKPTFEKRFLSIQNIVKESNKKV